MVKKQISKKQFIIYLIVAVGLAWILQIVASIFANKGNEIVFRGILAGCMYMPFLGVLVARIPLKGMGWVPHLKGRIRYIFFSLWMPVLLSVIGGVLFFVILPKVFDPEFTSLRMQMEQAGALQQLEEQGLTIPIYLVITFVQAITFAPFINMLVALGEEVGWRGVMFQYLKDKLGITKGRIVGGAIWGCWHWPVMILAGYEYGKEYIGAPVLGPIVFCLSTMAMGIILDYVYEKTETIWMPSLMHGSINAIATLFPFMVKPEYSNLSILGPAFIGIISMVPMLALAVIICLKQSKKQV